MPDEKGRLFAEDIAARIGIQPSDWRARVSRDHAPASVDYVTHRGAVRAVWDPETIAEYLRERDARLASRSSTTEGT